MKLSQYFGFERASVDRWLRNLVINFLPDLWIINSCVRPALARLCGMKCGSRVFLQKGVFYGNPKNVQIGDKSVICRGCFLDGYDKITIGNNVAIAFDVTFITSTHEMGTQEKRAGKLFGSPIVVGDGAWIAARAIIGPGTEIGAGSMVSVGAAVLRSVPANSLVAGVQGKVMMQLGGGAGLDRLPEPATACAEAGRVDSSVGREATDIGERKDGAMTKGEFYSALESLLELERGSIQGTESLDDLSHWDSMAVLAFIALAYSELHEVTSPPALAECRTVADLVKLFPGKIT